MKEEKVSVHELHNKPNPGMPLFAGPSALREEMIDLYGIDWVSSYIDPASYLVAKNTIVARHAFAMSRIEEKAGQYLKAKGIRLIFSTVKPDPVKVGKNDRR